jgi:hypothetical protein
MSEPLSPRWGAIVGKQGGPAVAQALGRAGVTSVRVAAFLAGDEEGASSVFRKLLAGAGRRLPDVVFRQWVQAAKQAWHQGHQRQAVLSSLAVPPAKRARQAEPPAARKPVKAEKPRATTGSMPDSSARDALLDLVVEFAIGMGPDCPRLVAFEAHCAKTRRGPSSGAVWKRLVREHLRPLVFTSLPSQAGGVTETRPATARPHFTTFRAVCSQLNELEVLPAEAKVLDLVDAMREEAGSRKARRGAVLKAMVWGAQLCDLPWATADRYLTAFSRGIGEGLSVVARGQARLLPAGLPRQWQRSAATASETVGLCDGAQWLRASGGVRWADAANVYSVRLYPRVLLFSSALVKAKARVPLHWPAPRFDQDGIDLGGTWLRRRAALGDAELSADGQALVGLRGIVPALATKRAARGGSVFNTERNPSYRHGCTLLQESMVRARQPLGLSAVELDETNPHGAKAWLDSLLQMLGAAPDQIDLVCHWAARGQGQQLRYSRVKLMQEAAAKLALVEAMRRGFSIANPAPAGWFAAASQQAQCDLAAWNPTLPPVPAAGEAGESDSD